MLESTEEPSRQFIMLYRTLRETGLIFFMLALGLPLAAFPVAAQDAAWDGLINAGRTALQQDQFSEAERHFEKALENAEKFPPGDPRLGRSLNNLAAVYYKQKDYDRAEPLMRRSLSVLEDLLGPDNADVAQTMKNLAAIYYLQGNFTDAEPLLKQSLAILEDLHGPNHAFVATVLNNLAALYQSQDRYIDAEPLLSRSLSIWETLLGKDHRDVVKSRELLARLREANGLAPDQAEDLQTTEAVPQQGTEIEPDVADQIVALAAEAEASFVEQSAETNVAASEPSSSPSDVDVEQAARALADLTASERAAAAGNAATAIDAAKTPESALPTPTIRTAAPPTPENEAVAGDVNFAVYLSTLWSEDEARRYWEALKQEIPDVLAGKEMEIEEVAFANGEGSFYRVLTSPYELDPAAKEACDEIKSLVRTHDCNVIAR